MEAVSSTAYFSSQPQLPDSASTAGGDPATPTASASRLARQPRRSSSFVTVEASSGAGGDDGVVRTRSLTEDDLEELKGCLDLGFGFAYSEIPGLCGTLPALELCYSMTRRFLDEQREPGHEQEASATPLPNWRISGPGKSFLSLSPQASISWK